jgi:hypothetical protein
MPKLPAEAEQHTLFPRSNRRLSGKDTTAVPKKRRRLQIEEQIDHGSSRQDPQIETSGKKSDTSICSLSDGSISEGDENEKINTNVPGEDRKQKAVSNVREVDDHSRKSQLKKYIIRQEFPHLTNAFFKMSNLSILDLFLSLESLNSDDMINDEQELLEELKSIFSQLSDDNDIAEMAKDEEQRFVLIEGLQIVRDILSNRVPRKKSASVRKRANGLRKNRRVLLSNDEDDSGDEYTGSDDSTELESSTDDTHPVVKKGFRKIREDSETVSSMRKRHQQMWKEYEARANM